jgi:hypothetical protein
VCPWYSWPDRWPARESPRQFLRLCRCAPWEYRIRNFGIDDAGAHRIDTNTISGQFFGEAQGHAVHGALGGGIVDVLFGSSDSGREGGQVDDGAPMSTLADGHAPHSLAGTQETAKYIAGEHPLPALDTHRLQTHLLFQGSGIVDQYIESTQALINLREEFFHFGLAGYVRLQREGTGTTAQEVGDQCLGRFRLLPVVDYDTVAALCGQACGRGADSAAGTGDQDDFAHAFSPIGLFP